MTFPIYTRQLGVALVYAELHDDGHHIILVPDGSNEVVRHTIHRLVHLTPHFTGTPGGGVLGGGGLMAPYTWPAVLQLEATFGTGWSPGEKLSRRIADDFGCRFQGYDPGEKLTVQLPDGLTPRAYQVTGALGIARMGRYLLHDDPGTGKTITAILGILEGGALYRHGDVLVVCPGSVVDSWVAAWQTWAPQYSAVAWRGTPAKRRALAGKHEVYVTSYDTARMDAKDTTRKSPLVALEAGTLVVDEVHACKTPSAARTQAVKRLAARSELFIGMSGTPITHSPADMWTALDALIPGAWPSRKRWVDRYCLQSAGQYGVTVHGLLPDREEEFRDAIAGQHRRVSKADVLRQLPPKVYSVRTVELPAPYRKAYDQMERDMLAELPDGTELPVMSVLAQLTRLNQLASAAADVQVTMQPDKETGEERPHYAVTLKAPSWKVDALLEILEERPGYPVLAFAHSRQLVNIAVSMAREAGLRVGEIVGGQKPAGRTAAVAAFQGGELDLLCATTAAGGVGLTLTAAGTVVFLQRPWSLVDALQAEDRAHRIGSEGHESIEIIDIVAARTIDARVRETLRERAGQLSALLQDRRIVETLLGGSK